MDMLWRCFCTRVSQHSNGISTRMHSIYVLGKITMEYVPESTDSFKSLQVECLPKLLHRHHGKLIIIFQFIFVVEEGQLTIKRIFRLKFADPGKEMGFLWDSHTGKQLHRKISKTCIFFPLSFAL